MNSHVNDVKIRDSKQGNPVCRWDKVKICGLWLQLSHRKTRHANTPLWAGPTVRKECIIIFSFPPYIFSGLGERSMHGDRLSQICYFLPAFVCFRIVIILIDINSSCLYQLGLSECFSKVTQYRVLGWPIQLCTCDDMRPNVTVTCIDMGREYIWTQWWWPGSPHLPYPKKGMISLCFLGCPYTIFSIRIVTILKFTH